MIQVIHEHSVDISLLSGGVCIDVGCLGFEFSVAMRDLGCDVWAYDIQDLAPPEGMYFLNAAISNRDEILKFSLTEDRQGCHISESGEGRVISYDINRIYRNATRHNCIDILKLDCEGSEYLILSDPNFQPMPKQITVEFHMHAFPELHAKYYDKCMENLLKHYVPVQHELTDRHCAGMNYWDSLFILKDLVK